tara:strand:- start:89889 stop:90569 length:681 start_codon:yes stop_codon:yes gene_type:complete
MPKTAGVSFRASLEEHFGERLRPDYDDYPLAQPAERRREQARLRGEAAQPAEFTDVGCVHGHFLPLKYLPLAQSRPCTFVTWLREPLARLASHYDYWQRSYDPDSGLTSSLHRRVVEEEWSLRRFCLAAELRNVYTEFLWGFPPKRLDFVGITEFFAEDLRYFSREILGNNLQPQTLNQRSQAAAPASEASLSHAERAEIEEFHAADLSLYHGALAQRRGRLSGRR